jgi:LPS-assembly lipoprotein
MSSRKTDAAEQRDAMGRRAVLGALAAALVTPLLTACGNGGFRPIYATGSFGGSNADDKLAQIKVNTIPGRVGQRIRNELIFQTTGGGERIEPAFALDIAIRESVTATLIKPNGDALGQVYNLDAAFRLTDLRTKQTVLEGTTYGRSGFERVTSSFANVRARENAENRAAKLVANEMRSRLSAYLATAT